MRSVLVIFLIVSLCLSCDHGAEANLSSPPSFYSPEAYAEFIQSLRKAFARGSARQLYDVPLLRPSLPDSERFHLIILNTTYGEEITLAADVVDLSFAAYRSRNKSYFFPNAAPAAFLTLFTDTDRSIMSFTNTYESLERAAGQKRPEIHLGRADTEFAISCLYDHKYVPFSFLVMIQTLLDAAKFKFIENTIVDKYKGNYRFTPSQAMLSLENNWSELSRQIQASKSLNGLFGKSIELYTSKDEPIGVDSIYYPILFSNIAFLQYHCQANFIRMPGIDDDSCYVQTRTTRISGHEGLCVTAPAESGAPLTLNSCGQQDNQKWTFQSDGTVRSLGKCMAASPSRFHDYAVVYDCDRARREEIRWEVSRTGTITNDPRDYLALTADVWAKSGANLTMDFNMYGARQSWRVGDYVKPIEVSIVGLQDMCLEATNKSKNVWLEKCDHKAEQYWAVYSDGSIRVNKDRSLCVTCYPLNSSWRDVFIDICSGISTQRWLFEADGTISNPGNDYRRMEVARGNVKLKKIIIGRTVAGSRSQQWKILY